MTIEGTLRTFLVAQLVGGGLAPESVRQAHRVLALILTLAFRDGRIPRNPAAGVPLYERCAGFFPVSLVISAGPGICVGCPASVDD